MHYAIRHITRFSYDAVGRLLTTTYPDGSAVSSAYDAAGQKTAEVNELGRTTRFTYDAAGRRISAIDPLGTTMLAAYDGGQQALYYRRNNTGGLWVYRRVLASWSGPYVRSHVAMRNGIAAVQFGDQISIFELSGGDYVRGSSATPMA
jgi:YD repeat-containing protein